MRSTKLPSWIERLLGLDPMPMPPHVFSVDENELRYGRFERSEEGVRIDAFERRALAPGTFLSGPLGGPFAETGTFGEVLGELLEESGRHEPDASRAAIDRASLVIPDRWLRLVFAEISEVPAATKAREEVLRWKLRRLVPFRVEDLRVEGVEVQPLRAQSEPKRIMLGFAIELLLSQLENAFRDHGIRIGQLCNGSLSLAQILLASAERGGGARTLLVHVQPQGYSLLYLNAAGEPALYRFKGLEPNLDSADVQALVTKELTLTYSFLREQVDDSGLGRVVLAAGEAVQAEWLGYLDRTIDQPCEILSSEHLCLSSLAVPAAAAHEWNGTAAMLGAALQEVA